jgi:hypothetical protein
MEGRGRLSIMPDRLNLSMTLRQFMFTYSSTPIHEIVQFVVHFSLACSTCENIAHEYSDPLISRPILQSEKTSIPSWLLVSWTEWRRSKAELALTTMRHFADWVCCNLYDVKQTGLNLQVRLQPYSCMNINLRRALAQLNPCN